ncbi:MAG: YraN family protein [Gemmataceae bacterium]
MSAENVARKPWWRRWFGNRSERAAVRFLKKLGYRILSRNFSCNLGELDIVALDGECIVFVEVRSTGNDDTDRPAQSVDATKQRKLTRLALYYLKRYRLLGRSARYDILALSWPPGKSEPEIRHYPSAFEPTDRFQMFS